MSIAMKLPDRAPLPTLLPLRFSAKEQRLRKYFVESFNDTQQSGLELRIAVRAVTDELKRAGELPEAIVKRIKYIAAIPVAFHYRAGYKTHNHRLKETVSEAISLSIERYFPQEAG